MTIKFGIILFTSVESEWVMIIAEIHVASVFQEISADLIVTVDASVDKTREQGSEFCWFSWTSSGHIISSRQKTSSDPTFTLSLLSHYSENPWSAWKFPRGKCTTGGNYNVGNFTDSSPILNFTFTSQPQNQCSLDNDTFHSNIRCGGDSFSSCGTLLIVSRLAQ